MNIVDNLKNHIMVHDFPWYYCNLTPFITYKYTVREIIWQSHKAHQSI